MEAWITVIVAFIVAASTLGATLLQNWHSNKRFEMEREKAKEEQERQREIDSSHWRREVRSQPLLKLRDVLARMAARLDMLVINAKAPQNLSETTQDAENKKTQLALKDLRDYMTSEEFLPTRHLQYDKELIKLMNDIEANYVLLFMFSLDIKNLKNESLRELLKLSQETKNLIPRVQELINKRLEEL